MAEEETITEEKKNKVISWIKEHPKTIFWVRFVLWVFCGAILPFLFIAFRFSLFNQLSGISLTGWGIVAIIIVCVFFISLIKYIKNGFFYKHVFISQCISGVCKIIVPLTCLLLITVNIKDNIDAFCQALICVLICEGLAIPINPMPQWVNDQQFDLEVEKRKDVSDYFIDKFFTRKKEEKNK